MSVCLFVRIINSWKTYSFNFAKCSIHKMNVCSYRHNMWFLIQNTNRNFFDACLRFSSSPKKRLSKNIRYTLRHCTTLLIFSSFVGNFFIDPLQFNTCRSTSFEWNILFNKFLALFFFFRSIWILICNFIVNIDTVCRMYILDVFLVLFHFVKLFHVFFFLIGFISC